MPAYQTCDVCRKRKTKCLPPPDDNEKHDKKAPCVNCARLGITCTYEHVYRRPGRPTSFARKSLSDESRERSSSPTTSYSRPPNGSHQFQGQFDNSVKNGPNPQAGPSVSFANHYPRVSISVHNDNPSPIQAGQSSHLDRTTSHGSIPTAISPTNIFHPPPVPMNRNLHPEHAQFASPGPLDPLFLLSNASPQRGLEESFNFSEWSEHDLVTDWPTTSSGKVASVGVMPVAEPSNGVRQSTSISAGPSTSVPSTTPITQPPGATDKRFLHQPLPAGSADIQLEDVAPWHTISFFITLYLGYSHSLFPLVHRPSFSQSLAMRRDKMDRDFRALVLGIGELENETQLMSVAYTIGQSPLGRMTSDYNRAELASLQHRSHRASMMLLDRSYRSPNVMHVGTLTAGYFYCQSVGKTTRALTLLAEACQLMHLLRMHDDDATAALGLDCVDVQIRRRIWWHIHAVDITEASAGNKIQLNSFEGRPTLPLEVDDEFLTSQGSFPQPGTQTSYMVGFVACIRQFPLLAEPITRLRTLQYRRRQGIQPSFEEIENETRWIRVALIELDAIMQGLPDILKLGWTFDEAMDEVRLAVMGMQRANLAITAVSIRFALADYKAELVQSGTISLDAERAIMGREAYETLSCIGLDDLAANGESMRGKIFRILLSLLKCNGESQDWFNTLQDWWSLFSRVQFVQLMAPNVDSRLPSRANSPEPVAGPTG